MRLFVGLWIVLACAVASADPPAWLQEKTLGFDVVSDKSVSVKDVKRSSRDAVLVTYVYPGFRTEDFEPGVAIMVADKIQMRTDEDWNAMLDKAAIGDTVKLGYLNIRNGRYAHMKTVDAEVMTRQQAAKQSVRTFKDPATGQSLVTLLASDEMKIVSSSIRLHFTLKDDNTPMSIYLAVSLRGPDWTFLDRIACVKGDERSSLKVPNESVRRDAKGTGISEVAVVPITAEGFKLLALSSQRNAPPTRLLTINEQPRMPVKLYFTGSGKSVEHDPRLEEMRALRVMMDAYEAYGGEWPKD